MDVGQPKDYLTGMRLYLQHLREADESQLAPDAEWIHGNVLIVRWKRFTVAFD